MGFYMVYIVVSISPHFTAVLETSDKIRFNTLEEGFLTTSFLATLYKSLASIREFYLLI